MSRLSKFLVIFATLSLLLVMGGRSEAFIFEERIATTKGLAHYAMGYIYDLYGMTNRAIFEYEQAAQFDDESYLTHLRLGTNYARVGMMTRAKEELKLVQKYNSEDLQSHYILALLYSTEKDFDKAAQEYEYILKQFSEADPKNIQIYKYLGQLYYSQNKFLEAISQFENILALEPDNSDIMYLLGSLYWEVGDFEGAEKVLRRSIENDPDHDGSLNTLGYLYAETSKNLDEAVSLVQRALEINPDNGAYLDSLGWVYYKKGDYQKALETLKQAQALIEDPVIYDHLGDVYYQLNDFEEAERHWDLSLRLYPDQEAVIQKIENLRSKQAKILNQ